MKVSQKTEYALRAMLELAMHPDDPALRTAAIAKNQQIPEKFLEIILVELRRAGLVLSHRGPVGGHKLAKAPDKISVGDIWRAIEGPAGRQAGGPDPFQGVWEAADKAVAGVVDHVSLAQIQEQATARRGVSDFNI